ncbi:OmpA family protein [Azospirillum sp. TSA6c]|uniref:OmpA family protein n=1 Tax=unclassified Azospirillum TaxID=2630922 RepID=UPI001304E08A|nr:OmpA family protein [Azospirillum sp. TSA6c]
MDRTRPPPACRGRTATFSERAFLTLGLALAVMSAFVQPSPAFAEGDVTLFQDVPSADEVLDALGAAPRPAMKMRGGPPASGQPQFKTRAVVFPGGQVVAAPPGSVEKVSVAVPPAPPSPSPAAGGASASSAPPSTSVPPPSPTVEAPRKQAPKAKPPFPSQASVAFPLTFELNSAELSVQARRYVDTIAEAMRKRPDLVVRVSGHTDASGGDEVNVPLSLRRAQAVHRYLIEKQGIDGARLVVQGEGARRPLDARNPYADVNRRVEFARELGNCDEAIGGCIKQPAAN